MKVRLQFRFGSTDFMPFSETVPLNFRIRQIPHRATSYRPLVVDYRGFKEGMKLTVSFFDEDSSCVKTETWEQWGSLKWDDFRPLPENAVYAKITTLASTLYKKRKKN